MMIWCRYIEVRSAFGSAEFAIFHRLVAADCRTVERSLLVGQRRHTIEAGALLGTIVRPSWLEFQLHSAVSSFGSQQSAVCDSCPVSSQQWVTVVQSAVSSG